MEKISVRCPMFQDGKGIIFTEEVVRFFNNTCKAYFIEKYPRACVTYWKKIKEAQHREAGSTSD